MASPAELRAAARTFALSLPEAWEDFPWGESTIKVRKKVFVFLGNDAPEGVPDDVLRVSAKLPQSMTDVLALPFATPTGYGLGKHGWVSLRIEAGVTVALEDLLGWIEESYRAVAPKTLVKALHASR